MYEYDGAAWTRITSGNTDNSGNTMVAFDDGLAVDFGNGGLWYYKDGNWTRLTTVNPQWLTSYFDYAYVLNNIPRSIPMFAADFGAYGLWRYEGDGWTKLHSGDADNSGNTMVGLRQFQPWIAASYYWYGSFVADFGVDGLSYYRQWGEWEEISSDNPEWLAPYIVDTSHNYLLIDFGESGLYLYNRGHYIDSEYSTLQKLSNADADNSENTMVTW